MAMGGFSGGDPAPTTDELASLVDSGRLRFVLLGGGPVGGPGGGPNGGFRAGPGAGPAGGTSGISEWVTANCTPVEDAGNGSLYDCAPAV